MKQVQHKLKVLTVKRGRSGKENPPFKDSGLSRNIRANRPKVNVQIKKLSQPFHTQTPSNTWRSQKRETSHIWKALEASATSTSTDTCRSIVPPCCRHIRSNPPSSYMSE
ncbi:hypothetical protein Ancab_021814 [Ancistrocladus abbreviatus]